MGKGLWTMKEKFADGWQGCRLWIAIGESDESSLDERNT